MCNYYGCLPSQLLAEDADQSVLYWLINNEYEHWRNKRDAEQRRLQRMK